MRRSPSKALFGILLVSTIVLGGFPICAVGETTVQDIINKGDSYDGQQVSVTGTVSNLKLRALEAGKNYMTFILTDKSGGRIRVFAWGQLKLQPGQKVTVTGTYRKVGKMAHHIFNNIIEASQIN